MNRLLTLWITVRDSLWFTPAAMVCASIVLALALVESQALVGEGLAREWPRLFGAGAEGARGMLSAIATSMITVAGVVFSITIVALSLAASQYSPRVLRNFMSDRPTQVVLGAFVSVFSYCLIVLRTIRGSEEGDFVPSLAVLGGVLLALVAVALLIYFIHHVASAIQVSAIVERIGSDTEAAIERLFPADVGEPPEQADTPVDAAPTRRTGAGRVCLVRAPYSGYLVSIDGDQLVRVAQTEDRFVEVLHPVGHYFLRGEALCEVLAPDQASHDDEGAFDALRGAFALQPDRTVQQDIAHGLQQLVDVALKALSPSVHDPRTAITCIHQLGHLMALLAARAMPASRRVVDGRLRLAVPTPAFDHLLGLAFDALSCHIASHVEAYAAVVDMQARIGGFTRDSARREALRRQLDRVALAIDAAHLHARDRDALRAAITEAGRGLAS